MHVKECILKSSPSCKYFLRILHKYYVDAIGLKINSCVTDPARKMKFSIKDFFSKCDQICRKLQIWSHLLKKPFMKNFIFFCALREKIEKNNNKNIARKKFPFQIKLLSDFAFFSFPSVRWAILYVNSLTFERIFDLTLWFLHLPIWN